MHPIALAAAVFVLAAVSAFPSVAAPIFIVNSTADAVAAAPLDSGPCETAMGNGVCTLRAAVMKSNHTPGGGATIRFGLPGAIMHTLSIPKAGVNDERTGDLNITADVTIEGNGSSNTIIDGNGVVTNDRIFFNEGRTMRIAGVTLQNGQSASDGGAIVSHGPLTIERSIIRNNRAQVGGGGISSSGPLALTAVTLASNSSGVHSLGTSGGGIYSRGTLQIVDSTISDNTSRDGGVGAGIWHEGSGTSTILRSTISGNISSGSGGGLATAGAIDVIDSTISGNFSVGRGGGLLTASSQPVQLRNSTVAFNVANSAGTGTAFGGGIFASSEFAVTLNNSIVANNGYATKFGQIGFITDNDCDGTVSSAGPNLFGIDDPTHCTINGSVTYGDPKLVALAANGGLTNTHALGSGSPAIDAAAIGGCNDALGAQLTSDQRGAPRHYPGGGRCDLGAFEAGPFFTLDVDASLTGTPYDALTDGLLTLRYLFGLTGPALTAGVAGATATRTAPADIKQYLDGYRSVLDVDDNGVADALTDGLLIIRHLFGLTGTALTQNALGSGANRNTAALIEAYLQTLKP